jgi:hypothetical protein
LAFQPLVAIVRLTAGKCPAALPVIFVEIFVERGTDETTKLKGPSDKLLRKKVVRKATILIF